jgi:hypothetical protein
MHLRRVDIGQRSRRCHVVPSRKNEQPYPRVLGANTATAAATSAPAVTATAIAGAVVRSPQHFSGVVVETYSSVFLFWRSSAAGD